MQSRFLIKAIDHTFYGFTGVITNAVCWETSRKAGKSRAEGEGFTSFSSVLPTSQMGYHAGKPIERVVYCFYKISLSKTENVSVFYEFTGTINHWLMVFNQSERAFYLSYFNKIKYTIESMVYCSHTAISRKVVGKIACGNPDRYCGWF